MTRVPVGRVGGAPNCQCSGFLTYTSCRPPIEHQNSVNGSSSWANGSCTTWSASRREIAKLYVENFTSRLILREACCAGPQDQHCQTFIVRSAATPRVSNRAMLPCKPHAANYSPRLGSIRPCVAASAIPDGRNGRCNRQDSVRDSPDAQAPLPRNPRQARLRSLLFR